MSNPLLSPPFFVIPTVSPDDPISAQLEQIDQLNTLLLQDIDHNFARFHQIVTTKLLPEIKRFALSSEPTREVSKFWKNFFEAAAAVRVPIPGEDDSLVSLNSHNNSNLYQHRGQYSPEGQDRDGGGGDRTPNPSDYHHCHGHGQQHNQNHPGDDSEDNLEDQSMTSDDASFLFGVGGLGGGMISSTPMRPGGGGGGSKGGQGQGQGNRLSTGTWASTPTGSEIESPFDRLDRKLRDDLRIGEEEYLGGSNNGGGGNNGGDYSTGQANPDWEEEPSIMLSKAEREANAKAASSAGILEDLALPKPRQQQQQQQPQSIKKASKESTSSSLSTGPTPRGVGKLPHPSQNPFTSHTQPSSYSNVQQPTTSSSHWNGIADLRNTPLNPKIKKFSGGVTPGTSKTKPFGLGPYSGGAGIGAGETTQQEEDYSQAYTDEQELDLQIQGISPPHTVQFNFQLPHRNLAKTPAKEAARLVIGDLMKEFESTSGAGFGFGFTPSPSLPTPPNFAKYGMGGGLDGGGSPSAIGSGSGSGSATRRRLFAEAAKADAIADETTQLEEGDKTDSGDTIEGNASHLTADADDTYHAARAQNFYAGEVDGDMTTEELDYNPTNAHGYGDEDDQAVPVGNLLEMTTREEEDDEEEEDGMDDSVTSEAGLVFGAIPGVRKMGFNLLGPDEMHTYRGGKLEDAGPSMDDSPSYGLTKIKAKKKKEEEEGAAAGKS